MGPVTRIYDNISRRLGDDLVTYLDQFDRMDVAVGYFNLRGWSVFDDLIATKAGEPAARILIGMVTPTEQAQTLEALQATAVKTLARRLMSRGGTMLGDVVGLGKTLTAIAVALMLRDEHGYQPLVVCPKNLVAMWEEHFEAYELHGRVVPYSTAHSVLPDLRRYAFVIIDESHTLRNDTRRDYKAIQDYIRANESKTLLLTATPYNIRFLDVANQLALYIDDDDDLGISPTNALAQDSRLADKVDGKITTLAAFRRSEDADDWKRLMSEHLVRRTRSFIKNNYAKTDPDGREYLEF